MAQTVFEKIVDEAAGIDLISEMSFQGLGEPTLDPGIVDRIRYAKSKRQGWLTTMFTNGHTLTPQLAKHLDDAGLNTLYVSLNASNAAGRHAVMRLNDYGKVVEAIKDSMAVVRNMKIIPKGVIAMDIFAGNEVEAFRSEWGSNGFLHHEGNWAGATFKVRREKTLACQRALGQIMVLWDGRVSLCCFDGEGDVIFGDLTKQTLRDVYVNPEWVRYRELHSLGKREGLKLCSTCTDI